MGRPRKHAPEAGVTKLRQVEVMVAQGATVAEAVRAVGTTEPSYYRGRKEYAGLKLDQVKRMKAPEAENARRQGGGRSHA